MCCCDRGCESARIGGFDERLARGGGGGRDRRDILREEDERENERERKVNGERISHLVGF